MSPFPPPKWNPGEQPAFEEAVNTGQLAGKYSMFRRPKGQGNVNQFATVSVYNLLTGETFTYSDNGRPIGDAKHG